MYIVILIYMQCLANPRPQIGSKALCDHEIALKHKFTGSQSLRQKKQQFLIVSYSHCSC